MNEEEFRLKLNLNLPVEIYGLQVKQLTIGEILDKTGYTAFNSIRNFVNFNIEYIEYDIAKEIKDYMFDVKENLIELYPSIYKLDFSLFDMCYYVPFIRDMFISFLKTFTIHKDFVVFHQQTLDELIITYDDEQLSLNRIQFESFIDLFSILNYTTKVDREIIKQNDKVKDFDNKVDEIKKRCGFKEKQDITLESIISALIDSDNTSYTHETASSKTIYQVMTSFHRMCRIKDNEFMNLIRINSTQKIKERDIKNSLWYYNFY